MLQNNPTSTFKTDPALISLYGIAKNAQTRIQTMMIEDLEEDRLLRLLELNDLINSIIQNYDDLKQGNSIHSVKNVKKEVVKKEVVKKKVVKKEVNLIDFDVDETPLDTRNNVQPNNDLAFLDFTVYLYLHLNFDLIEYRITQHQHQSRGINTKR